MAKCATDIPSIKHYEGNYKTSKEYVNALTEWMAKAYQQQCINAAFPFMFATAMQHSQQQPTTTNANNSPPNNTTQTFPRRGKEYILPSMWKRFMAEAIDFFLLFVIKLALTYIAVETFEVLDVDSQIYEALTSETIFTDYKVTMDVTWDILVLETVYRIGNCVFEALCLHRGRGTEGGATPGKKLLGLKVVKYEWCAPTLNDQILVYPATDIGLCRAFIRAIAKNLVMTFLFPLCITMVMYQQNRTVYDSLSGCIVVEEIVNPARPNRNNNGR